MLERLFKLGANKARVGTKLLADMVHPVVAILSVLFIVNYMLLG